MIDKKSLKLINNLHPKVKDKFIQFMSDLIKSGYSPRVASGYRTIAEQNALYAQGRTAPGSVVTNAKGGQSFHNYGLAIDLYDAKKGWDLETYKKYEPIAKKHGIEWGGNWSNFKDNPHFQITFGYDFQKLYDKITMNQVDNKGYVLI